MNSNNYTSDCINNNYLFQGSQLYQWTITANNTGNSIVRIANTGRTTRQNVGNSYSYNYRPTVYLKSSVKIKTNVGDGSSTHPYELTTD